MKFRIIDHRTFELLLHSGTTLLGVLFAIDHISHFFSPITYLPVLASFICLYQGYLFNDWAGYKEDLKDVSKKNRLIFSIGRKNALIISIFLIIVYLAIMFFLKLFFVGFLLVFISIAYSHPLTNYKTKPFLPYILFYLTILLYFSAGYLMYSSNWYDLLLFSAFFGCMYIAGQINQELRDYEIDSENNVFTTVQLLPKKYFFIILNMIFFLSVFVFFMILRKNYISLYSFCIYAISVVFFMIFSMKQGFRMNLISSFFAKNKKTYQILYFFLGIIIVIDRLLKIK